MADQFHLSKASLPDVPQDLVRMAQEGLLGELPPPPTCHHLALPTALSSNTEVASLKTSPQCKTKQENPNQNNQHQKTLTSTGDHLRASLRHHHEPPVPDGEAPSHSQALCD